MRKKSISIIIIVLVIIFCIMSYLICSNYISEKSISENISKMESKNWKIHKYSDHYELYINDNEKDNGSNIYLLDKNNNLIYTFSDYRKNWYAYISYYDISATSKVIISKDKIKYNKDKSKSLKFAGTTMDNSTTNSNNTTTSTQSSTSKITVKILGD